MNSTVSTAGKRNAVDAGFSRLAADSLWNMWAGTGDLWGLIEDTKEENMLKHTPRLGFLPARLAPLLLVVLALLAAACNQHAFSSNGHGEYSWTHGPRKVVVKSLGEIEFSPDDADVARLSSDGYLMVEESIGWDSKIIEFSAGANGQVQKRLLLDGKEQPFDATSQAWMRRLLPEVIRRTGLSAESRARRILETGGYRALANELDQIVSSSAAARYVEIAFETGSLTENEQVDLLRRLPRFVHSDSQRTDLLRQLSGRSLSESMRAPYFDAVDSIGSNSNRTYLLSELLANDAADIPFMVRLLESAGRIGSDSDKARLLSEAVTKLPQDAAVRETFLSAVTRIGSDSNKTHVLQALLRAADQDSELLVAMLETSHTIGSNSNKSALLAQAARHAGRNAGIREAFFTAAETIGSNSDRLHVLASVLESPEVDAATLSRLYRAGASMGSDSNKADLLVRSLPAYRNDPEARRAFFTMAGTIGSSSNRSHVFAAMLDLPSLDAETVLALIESTESIGSDSDKAEVLSRAAPRRDSDPRIQPRLLRAAKTIGSDSSYRRVMSALQPNGGESRGED